MSINKHIAEAYVALWPRWPWFVISVTPYVNTFNLLLKHRQRVL